MLPSFQIKVVFAFHLAIWSSEEEWRGTECKLQYEVSTVNDDLGSMLSAGVAPLYYIKSIKLYRDADFIFQ